jgi:hypothetical protein
VVLKLALGRLQLRRVSLLANTAKYPLNIASLDPYTCFFFFRAGPKTDR